MVMMLDARLTEAARRDRPSGAETEKSARGRRGGKKATVNTPSQRECIYIIDIIITIHWGRRSHTCTDPCARSWSSSSLRASLALLMMMMSRGDLYKKAMLTTNLRFSSL